MGLVNGLEALSVSWRQAHWVPWQVMPWANCLKATATTMTTDNLPIQTLFIDRGTVSCSPCW